jgi:hypothetical protein
MITPLTYKPIKIKIFITQNLKILRKFINKIIINCKPIELAIKFINNLVDGFKIT